ncbi:MAG: hypothetical protein WA826_06755, partial [Silvibacterium sp.]
LCDWVLRRSRLPIHMGTVSRFRNWLFLEVVRDGWMKRGGAGQINGVLNGIDSKFGSLRGLDLNQRPLGYEGN